MNTKVFKCKNDLELVVKNRKSAIIFELNQDNKNGNMRFIFDFSEDVFKEFINYIETIANESWKGIELKEILSFGNDYYEYYDKELDNNGYLDIGRELLMIERPSLESQRLYQFNKKKIETFLYDLKNI